MFKSVTIVTCGVISQNCPKNELTQTHCSIVEFKVAHVPLLIQQDGTQGAVKIQIIS